MKLQLLLNSEKFMLNLVSQNYFYPFVVCKLIKFGQHPVEAFNKTFKCRFAGINPKAK